MAFLGQDVTLYPSVGNWYDHDPDEPTPSSTATTTMPLRNNASNRIGRPLIRPSRRQLPEAPGIIIHPASPPKTRRPSPPPDHDTNQNHGLLAVPPKISQEEKDRKRLRRVQREQAAEREKKMKRRRYDAEGGLVMPPPPAPTPEPAASTTTTTTTTTTTLPTRNAASAARPPAAHPNTPQQNGATTVVLEDGTEVPLRRSTIQSLIPPLPPPEYLYAKRNWDGRPAAPSPSSKSSKKERQKPPRSFLGRKHPAGILDWQYHVQRNRELLEWVAQPNPMHPRPRAPPGGSGGGGRRHTGTRRGPNYHDHSNPAGGVRRVQAKPIPSWVAKRFTRRAYPSTAPRRPVPQLPLPTTWTSPQPVPDLPRPLTPASLRAFVAAETSMREEGFVAAESNVPLREAFKPAESNVLLREAFKPAASVFPLRKGFWPAESVTPLFEGAWPAESISLLRQGFLPAQWDPLSFTTVDPEPSPPPPTSEEREASKRRRERQRVQEKQERRQRKKLTREKSKEEDAFMGALFDFNAAVEGLCEEGKRREVERREEGETRLTDDEERVGGR